MFTNNEQLLILR